MRLHMSVMCTIYALKSVLTSISLKLIQLKMSSIKVDKLLYYLFSEGLLFVTGVVSGD